MAKENFLPAKPIVFPLPGDFFVSYGDRLLWYQLGLQITGHPSLILTKQEYVRTVMGFYHDALRHNVESYLPYFNGEQPTMGLRRGPEYEHLERVLPVPVEFAPEND